MEKLLICLDPGHGRPDPGAIGSTGLREADVVLLVAHLTKQELKQRGYKTPLLTRLGPESPANAAPWNVTRDLARRCEIANSAPADVFVSIHCNSHSRPEAHGTETWYCEGSARGRDLAEAMQAALVEELGLADRGAKPTRSLYVLKHTVMPAVLVELAFISNPAEEQLLRDETWLARAGRAIADGIDRYVRGGDP